MSEINLNHVIDILSRTPAVLRALLDGLPAELALSNDGEQTWSPFDVLGHLIHGEQTDWIPRVRIILHDGEGHTFEPFDRYAQFEASKGKTVEELLNTFEALRLDSLRVLKELELKPEDFAKAGTHPEFGRVRLGQLIATWVAHDLSHLAQISRTMSRQYREAVGPWRQYLSVMK